MKPFVVLVGLFLAVSPSWSSALAGGSGGPWNVRGQGTPGLQGQILPSPPLPGPRFHGQSTPSLQGQPLHSPPLHSPPLNGPSFPNHSLHSELSPHRIDRFHHSVPKFHQGDHRFFGFGGAVVIVPWWGYFPAYPYPGYPASPTQGDLVPDYSDPASSAVAYGSTVLTPSYSMSITSALQPPAPTPDSADATPFPGDAEAELANCQATWVDGYYETRVWPNGQPETFWVRPRWVCQ